MEGSSLPEALTLVLRARRRLRVAAVLEGFAAPAAVFLLVASAVLAVSRIAGREDVPAGFLGAVASLCFLAGAARTARSFAGAEGAALHLDRALGTGERFVTALETAETDPAIASWAARGAMERARNGDLEEAMALRPPAALLPLALAAAVVSGLALLSPAGSKVPPGIAEVPVAATASSGAAGDPATPGTTKVLPDPRKAAAAAAGRAVAGAAREEEARAALDALEERARAARSEEAALALREAREALARGDRVGAGAAVRRAVEALYGAIPADGGTAVPGATGGGTAAADGGARGPRADASFRASSVPLRAREAVRRYFGKDVE